MIAKTLCAVTMAASIGTAANASEIRRVVTTLDSKDRSTTLFDSELPLQISKSGNANANLWVTDSAPAGFSQHDTAHSISGIAPPRNGTVLRVVEIPPGNEAQAEKTDPHLMMKIAGSNAPARGAPVSNPLMHRTRTVDYAIVMSGEIDLVLDDKTLHLKPGDVVVQQATNHAWINHGKEPCRIIFVLMDSKEP